MLMLTLIAEEVEQRAGRRDPQKKYLFVLDGGKALAKAVRSRFGVEVLIQRCQVHKQRNVLGHLPPRYHRRFAGRLKAAWSMKDCPRRI